MKPAHRSAFVSLALILALATPGAQSSRFDATTMVSDLGRLAADRMEGRRVGTEGGARARALLLERFRAVGLEPAGGTFEHPFTVGVGDVPGVNVLGILPGRVTPARYIVVSAHYDHVGVRNGRIFNGANDNASGAAALPAIAGYFARHRPDLSLLFAAFDGEEAGLSGARTFVREPPIARHSILINLNLDMIGRDPANTLYVVGTSRQPALVPLIEGVAASAPVRLRMGYDTPDAPADWTRDSDHWAFLEAGIPALYFGVEDSRYIHQPDDDFESMTIDFYVRAVETILRVIEAVDTDPGVVPAHQ